MNEQEIEKDTELQKVLWACYDYWQAETKLHPNEKHPEKIGVCYHWIIKRFEARFNRKFHPSKLKRLAQMNFLIEEDTSRGGGRRYYRLADPDNLGIRLKGWGLD